MLTHIYVCVYSNVTFVYYYVADVLTHCSTYVKTFPHTNDTNATMKAYLFIFYISIVVVTKKKQNKGKSIKQN